MGDTAERLRALGLSEYFVQQHISRGAGMKWIKPKVLALADRGWGKQRIADRFQVPVEIVTLALGDLRPGSVIGRRVLARGGNPCAVRDYPIVRDETKPKIARIRLIPQTS